jgi:hypothetical protein
MLSKSAVPQMEEASKMVEMTLPAGTSAHLVQSHGQQPLVLTDLVERDLLLDLFGGLESDAELRDRFLDDPVSVLAAQIGLDPARQERSADNALLVELLRSPEMLSWIRDNWYGRGADATDDFGSTVTSASVSSSSSSSFGSGISSSSGVSSSTSTTFGGHDAEPTDAVDAAVLRLGIARILASLRAR